MAGMHGGCGGREGWSYQVVLVGDRLFVHCWAGAERGNFGWKQ